MDLSLSETQQMVKATAREFLEKECPRTLVRAMEEDAQGFPPALWRKIASLGWPGLAFPQEYGGSGGDFLDLVVLLEEMGRFLLPGPFFSTVVLGGLTLLDAGSEIQKRQYLPKLCEGDVILTMALTEPDATYDPSGIRLESRLEGDEYILNCTKLFVPDAHVADQILVAVRTGDSPDPTEGITLLIVPAASQGLTVTPLKTLAGDKQFEVLFQDVRVPSNNTLGELGGGWPLVERALQRGAAGSCALMVGGAEAVLEMTVDYVNHRMQFGQPVGSFQAIQHHCANMATDVDGSRLVTYQAAWKLAQGLPAAREVSVSKAWVSEAYLRVCALAHQCHGAMGFTWEYDLQLYTRRAKTLELAFGDAAHHREILANLT